MTGAVLKSTELSADTDLRRTLAEAKEDWEANGWRIESGWQQSAHFFCHRGGVRRRVGTQPTDPAKPLKLGN